MDTSRLLGRFTCWAGCWRSIMGLVATKWEDPQPGTDRKDGLRVLECTHFRRTPNSSLPISSELIKLAELAFLSPDVQRALHLDSAGDIDGLLTGVGSRQTARGRSRNSRPGSCFLHAGWIEIEKRKGRADIWLSKPCPPFLRDLCGGDCEVHSRKK